ARLRYQYLSVVSSGRVAVPRDAAPSRVPRDLRDADRRDRPLSARARKRRSAPLGLALFLSSPRFPTTRPGRRPDPRPRAVEDRRRPRVSLADPDLEAPRRGRGVPDAPGRSAGPPAPSPRGPRS